MTLYDYLIILACSECDYYVGDTLEYYDEQYNKEPIWRCLGSENGVVCKCIEDSVNNVLKLINK